MSGKFLFATRPNAAALSRVPCSKQAVKAAKLIGRARAEVLIP